MGILTTTDHKIIGNLYLATSFGFFLLGGLLALGIRAELAAPGLQVVDNAEQFNQLFTMHGTIMLLLFATPLFAGFANALVPLQIGSPDVAFPRLNALAYWFYVFGGLVVVSGFLTPGGAAVRVWAATCGCLGWRSRDSGRFWVRSTSSRPSSPCARPG